MSTTQSKKINVELDEEATEALNKIKKSLTSSDIILAYPDYTKAFHLTTDASKYALGAILSQEEKPIAFISRTLTRAEENYAGNEREMLAIIRALNVFRNYLYGTAKVIIHTDHETLTKALNPKNNNTKMKSIITNASINQGKKI